MTLRSRRRSMSQLVTSFHIFEHGLTSIKGTFILSAIILAYIASIVIFYYTLILEFLLSVALWLLVTMRMVLIDLP
jgi:hypothetical protein